MMLRSLSAAPAPWLEPRRRRATSVHVVQTLSVGGIETLVVDLLRKDPNHRVIALEGRVDDMVAQWPDLAKLRDRIDSLEKTPGWAPRAVVTLARRLRALSPRAVVLHHMGPLVYGSLATCFVRDTAVVHFEHDAWHYDAKPSDARLVRRLSRLGTLRHVAASQSVATRLAVICGQSVAVIPPGIDLDRFVPADQKAAQRALGLSPDRRWVGTVGRLVAVKDQASLIRALAELPADVGLVLVGDGPERAALTGLVSHLALEGRVVFLGQRGEIEKLLPAFDVFALTSRSEGLPRAILEAQACGLPVVATDVGGLRQAVCPASGHLVPAENPGAVAAALRQVLSVPADRLSPREFVAQRFGLETVIARLNAVIVGRADSPALEGHHGS